MVRGLTAGGTGGISAAKSAGLTDKERVVINEKRFALLLCVCLALTALAGCSGKTKEMQKVTVCEVTHSIFYAPQYVALAKGFFADEGWTWSFPTAAARTK